MSAPDYQAFKFSTLAWFDVAQSLGFMGYGVARN